MKYDVKSQIRYSVRGDNSPLLNPPFWIPRKIQIQDTFNLEFSEFYDTKIFYTYITHEL